MQEGMQRLTTGVAGLDVVLLGGLIPSRSYLVRGTAGTGKTVLGLHFLTAGAARGERVLFISLMEPERNIRQNAAALGFNMEGVAFLDLSPTPEYFARVETYDIFAPAEVERAPMTRAIIERIDEVQPQRVFVDSMTQFRYLSPDPFQFRKQVLSFLRYLIDRGATVLSSSEPGPGTPDDDLQFISDGVLTLEVTPEGREIWVGKFRGSAFREGRHSMRLTDRGMLVFPHLVPEEFGQPFVPERVPSGVPELDELLDGGVERGTVTIIGGPRPEEPPDPHPVHRAVAATAGEPQP